ncbi:MAG TPA: M20 family metallo-hydrolase [Candidatus Eisenbacteria bacterium]|nr:M20 family metallo-hydrolase [Candidatus Eisenbacteria bacterium]
MQTNEIFSQIEKQKDAMVQTLMELIRIPAIAPENGGDGETKKADRLTELLKTMGFDDIQHYDADDDRVPSKKRPNIVTRLIGETDAEKLWIITHLDIVPEGEESLWTIAKPFQPVIKDGRVYGRGSEDNMHSMIASLFALKTLKDLGIKPKRTVALGFVADEEQGSKYGIQYLIGKGLFSKQDLLIVPDSGNENGSFIEISEKSALWFRIRTIGKQTHASRPQMGLNAHRIGMQFSLALDEMLHTKYSCRDDYFDPPESTIEPTKKDKNVDAVNIAPGEDIVYFDCRVLPDYRLDDFLNDINMLARDYEKKTGSTIRIEIIQKTVAPKPTSPDAKVVKMLEQAVREVRRVEPKVGGIGGGTCAAYFREIGLPSVVWSTIDETAHQPNEYTKIENLVSDAKVYALLSMI